MQKQGPFYKHFMAIKDEVKANRTPDTVANEFNQYCNSAKLGYLCEYIMYFVPLWSGIGIFDDLMLSTAYVEHLTIKYMVLQMKKVQAGLLVRKLMKVTHECIV